MPRTITEVETGLTTHTKIAVGFMVATATVVLVSAIATAILTALARPSASPGSSASADRTFETR